MQARKAAAVTLMLAMGLVLASHGAVAQGPGSARNCGTYPPEVYQQVYTAFADCWLRQMGEKPLWKSRLTAHYPQQIRFTFVDGHLSYAQVIDFVEFADGSGRVKLKTVRPRGADGKLTVEVRRNARVSPEDVGRLNALAASSEVWKFEIGSWDGDEIYVHCQTLDMERIDSAGYRFSSVNISCNRPRNPEPLLDHLTGLAGLKLRGAVY
jgi:hypothetical protein